MPSSVHLAVPVTGTETASDGVRIYDLKAFSPRRLRDKVVIMALFDQIVTEEQVAALWRLWRQQHLPFSRAPLWRLLPLLPHVEPELIYEQSARAAGIEKAYITPGKSINMLRMLAPRTPPPVWQKMIEVPVLPVDETGFGHAKETAVVHATHDPTNPMIRELLLQAYTDSFEVRYAPRKVLLALLEEAFPSGRQPVPRAAGS